MALKWTTQESIAIERNPNVERGEFLDAMTFQSNQRPLFTELFGPLLGTKEAWEAQGASEAELDFSAFHYRCEKRYTLDAHSGYFGGEPERVLEETAEHILTRDSYGRAMRLVKGFATIPLPLDYPVKTMEDWLRIRHHYQFHPDRLGADWEAKARSALSEGSVLQVNLPGGFDEPHQLMGEEAVCVAVYDQPELIEDMLATIGEMVYQLFDEITRRVPVDLLFVHEDMAGKSGPLWGPRQVRKFIVPYYRRAWDLVASRGARVFEQDSDGNIESVLDAFLEAGINCVYPVEPAAGMDMARLRERYGKRLSFRGGIDKFALTRGKQAIDVELAYKVPPMLKDGGVVFGLDHRIPMEVPLENYRYYVRRMGELLGIE